MLRKRCKPASKVSSFPELKKKTIVVGLIYSIGSIVKKILLNSAGCSFVLFLLIGNVLEDIATTLLTKQLFTLFPHFLSLSGFFVDIRRTNGEWYC